MQWQMCMRCRTPQALSSPSGSPSKLTRGLALSTAAGVCLPDFQHALLRVEGAAQQADDLAAAAGGVGRRGQGAGACAAVSCFSEGRWGGRQ